MGDLTVQGMTEYVKDRMYKKASFQNLESFERTLQKEWFVEGGIIGLFPKDSEGAKVYDKFVRTH
jgi:hypothetical protein